MKAHAQTSFYTNTVDFWLSEERGDKRFIGQPVVMENLDIGLIAQPTFQLGTAQAQELFEQMWKQGFRSQHDRGNTDALDAARREHIADLRKAAKLS